MLLENFLQDVRIGLRVLIKEKGFCALAVAVIALGICGVTTMFSVVNGVLLRGFSFPTADRLMSVQFIDPAQTNFFGTANQIFALDFQDMQKEQKSFEHLAAFINGATVNLTYQGNPQRYTGGYVTDAFMKILGVTPIMGRDFTAADNTPGAEKVALISHQLWSRDFGSRRDIVGQAVRLNGKSATIIGVMPPGFAFPQNEELWIPLFSEFPPRPRSDRNNAGSNTPAVIGLLRHDITLEQATLEVGTYAARFAKEFPDTNKNFATGFVQPLIKTFTPRPLQGILYSMLAVCVAVLLLACANVMNMQFARATLRAKELAIRSSLGATRGRLIRQMLTESLLLAGIGATLGTALAYQATAYLLASVRNLPNPIPAYITFDIDGVVLGFIVLAAVLSAVVSGVLPAWMASQAHPVEVLKESGRGNTSRGITLITRGLVVVQILLTCVILIASLLQIKSIIQQQTVDYGYDTASVATARMGLMDGDYPTSDARRLFYDRLLRELRASPDIESAALTNRLRMAFTITGPARIEIEGRTYADNKDRPNVNAENITDGYFSTIGAKLREGRDFHLDDTDAKQPVAIVNAGFAAKYWPGQSALGRRFRTVGNNGTLFGPWRTIVGVVSDVRMTGPFNNPNVESFGFYLPYYSTQFGPATLAPVATQFATIVVKPRNGQAALFANSLRAAVKRVDPNLPIYFVGTAKENLDSFLGQNRIIAVMFTLFGAVALVLAAVGLYGVMSFSVNQRTQEFGIRMALGANARAILAMVLRQGAVQLVVGLALGVGAALAIATVGGSGIRNVLFNVSPLDPTVYAAVLGVLSFVALVATLIPAQRATRVDPMIALRAE
ncbi:MAG: ABC transporter permease [Verrucomicrobia bacterium]|nr:ABC transporter permease [Verrucomicrobiota bacterium]